MPRGYLALVVELHHRLPAPSQGSGSGADWASAAVGTYWPLLRSLVAAADAGLAEVATLAVSPAWTAQAADPAAQEDVRAELDRRADRPPEGPAWAEHWHALRQFVVDRWGSDPLGAVRHVAESAAVEVIPTTASHAWLPAVADAPVVARAQVALAAVDHERLFGARARGIWLPHLAYRPGLEGEIAGRRLGYFGVDAEAFRRGTVRPPADVFGHLVTPPGAAAFGVDAALARPLTDPSRGDGDGPRPADPATAPAALADRAARFVAGWREALGRAPRPEPAPPIGVAAVSAHELVGGWVPGSDWLERTLFALADSADWPATTPGRYLDRHPEGPLGRPGPSARGLRWARPADSDLMDRCRDAADLLADAVEARAALDPPGRRAVAQMARSLLAAQAMDWDLPPGRGLTPEAGLWRAGLHLARVAELAGLLAAGRLERAHLATLEAGPTYLPEIDPDLLAGD